MGRFNDTGYGTIRLAGETKKSIRVTATGAIAGATDQDIGITIAGGILDDVVGVSWANKQGLQKAKCEVDVTAGDRIFTAAGGMITNVPVPGAFFRGIAADDGVAGEIIGIMPALATDAVA